MSEKPRYLSAKQVAERYGVSPQWPYRCKDLQKYRRKIGQYVRFLESDLELFEKERWSPESNSHKIPGEMFMRLRVKHEETIMAKKPLVFDLESKD